MLIRSNGPEAYLPPRLFDKVKSRLDLKPHLKIDKETFEVPENPKCPKSCFVVNLVFAKLQFSVRQDCEDSKIPYDRDGFSKEAVDTCDEEEDEDDES